MQQIETGNFNYQNTIPDNNRNESNVVSNKSGVQAAGIEPAHKVNTQQYRVRPSRDQNSYMYAPPNYEMHIEGYGGATMPHLSGTGQSRQRALSGGPTLRGQYVSSRNPSISEGRSNRSGSVGVGSPASRKSGMSRRSGMTRNPMHFEEKQLQHTGPGIDDRISHLYREYDNGKRVGQTFYERAALASFKNLETVSYRKDSTIRKTQGRFPEKYVNTIRKSDTNYSS